MDYQMAFKWPYGRSRCGATMITDQMALTAAHCISERENGPNTQHRVQMHNGEIFGIKEFRTNECWDFNTGSPYSADIAIMILDRPIPNAIKGVHYVDPWNAEDMGDVIGREFILAGWGQSGEVRPDMSDGHFTGMDIFHRGYNIFNEISGQSLSH